MSDVRCMVFRPQNMDALHVVIHRMVGDMEQIFVPAADSEGRILWEWREYSSMSLEQFNPTFIIPRYLERFGVVQELVDELYKQTGIMTSGLKELADTNDAQKAHLSDLQKLLFRSDFVNIQRGEPKIIASDEKLVQEGEGF